MKKVSISQSLLTPEEAQIWAQKVPVLLRQQFAAIPDVASQVDTGSLNGQSYKILGIGIGAILGVSTLTSLIPGKWKWLSGAGAVGSIVAGLEYGNDIDKAVSAVKYIMPEMKKAFLAYADAIENDSDLREQLAAHLAANVTAKETSFRPLELAVLGKALEFGQSTPYLDIKSISKNVNHTWRCAENPNRGDCALAR